jgi:phage baseplate assembly protein V
MTMAPQAPTSISVSVVPALVTRNDDTQGRVKVRYPWMDDKGESDWIAVSGPGAGHDCGLFCIPAADDQVLVAFSFGQIDKAYVIGSLWSTADKPPSAGNPDKRTWKSKTGHVIVLDDTSGAEQISIVDRSGGNKITIDTASKSITIESAGDLTIKAAGNLTLSSGKDVTVNGSNLTLAATSQLAAKGSSMTLDGPAGVKINDGALEVV